MKKMLFFGVALIVAMPGWGLALDPDFQLVKSVGVEPNGPALLKYFKERTLTEADPKALARLIRQLGDDSFQVRDSAYVDIVKLGPACLDGLKQAAEDPDLEIKLRVEEIKKVVLAKVQPGVQAAAARLVAAIRPAGAPEVLLAYLPFAADQEVSDEVSAAIKATAIRKGVVDPVVVKALTDTLAVKRMAAAEALAGDKDHLPAIRKMMQDADPRVRFRIARALVIAREKEAVPVLVDLMGVLNADQLWQAEEILIRLAGKDAPVVPLGHDEESRKKCREAWQDWLTNNGDNLDMAKVGELNTQLGYTLIVQQTGNRFVGGKQIRQTGEVMEIDREKRVRWKFELNNINNPNRNASYPVDAQVLRHDRVLVAEYNNSTVTERDFTGKILWEQNVGGGNPISVQGLPNDNVFVVLQNRLVEYDRNHKEVFSFTRPNHDIFRGKKLRNGDMVFITNQGQYVRIDATRKVLKTFFTVPIPVLFGSIDVLPSGGVLVPDFNQSHVFEFDVDGKKVNQFNVASPNSVSRLPNGNTLVGSQSTQTITEFDPRGQEVWSYRTDGTMFNTRKR
jgi:outer membrane protein assembly factor BamB